jgi:putative exporter of polyketide antibiotics
MVLSTPHPRWQVALQSYLAAIIGFVLLALATTAGVLAAALVTHLAIDAGRVLAASLAFVPPMAVVASAVYALGARLRSGAVMGIVGAYLGLAFFMDLLRSFLNLPSWILHLSVFNAYGQPMLNGIDWTASITMLALAVLFAAAGIYLFQTGDLRQGG